MTLSSWFREYVYIPLGGNRCGFARQIFNMFVVWAFTGLWHGASWNFVIWGLMYFVLLVFEKAGWLKIEERAPIVGRIFTLVFVCVGWVIFYITDLPSLGLFFTRMFTLKTVATGSAEIGALYYLRNYAVSIAIGCFFSTDTASALYANVRRCRPVKLALMLLLFFVCTAYLVDSTYNPFLYFRF